MPDRRRARVRGRRPGGGGRPAGWRRWRCWTRLNRLGGEHGIGRVDLVENRFVGHEVARRLRDPGRHHPARRAPGAGVAHARPRGAAPARLARAALRRDDLLRLLVLARARGAAALHGRVRSGTSRAPCASSSTRATSRWPGGARRARSTAPTSPRSRPTRVYRQRDAEGFINLNALRLKIRALRDRRPLSRCALDVVAARRPRARSRAPAPAPPRSSSTCCARRTTHHHRARQRLPGHRAGGRARGGARGAPPTMPPAALARRRARVATPLAGLRPRQLARWSSPRERVGGRDGRVHDEQRHAGPARGPAGGGGRAWPRFVNLTAAAGVGARRGADARGRVRGRARRPRRSRTRCARGSWWSACWRRRRAPQRAARPPPRRPPRRAPTARTLARLAAGRPAGAAPGIAAGRAGRGRLPRRSTRSRWCPLYSARR